MPKSRAVLSLAFGLLVGGILMAEVDVEFSPSFDFDAYSTYAWKEGTPARRVVAEQRIGDAVDRELSAAGLRRVSADADLWIVSHVLVDRHSLDDLDHPEYWEFYTGVQSVDAFDLGAGTLVVDLIDTRLERVVWRAAASETIRGGTKPNLRKIDKAIHKIFKRLPRSSP